MIYVTGVIIGLLCVLITEYIRDTRITALIEADNVLAKAHKDCLEAHETYRVFEQPNARTAMANKMVSIASQREKIAKKLRLLSEDGDLSNLLEM